MRDRETLQTSENFLHRRIALPTAAFLATLALWAGIDAINGSGYVEASNPNLGDADCSNQVDPVDALHVLFYHASLREELDCIENADVNFDDQIGPLDAQLILQNSAGIIVDLPKPATRELFEHK